MYRNGSKFRRVSGNSLKVRSWRSFLSDLEVELQGKNGLGYPVGRRPHMRNMSCASCRVQGQDKKTSACMDFLSITTSYGQSFL